LLAHAKDPAILIECGFLSNASEAKLLNDTAYQQKMADAVTHGILNYQKQGAAVSSAVSSNRLYSSVSSAIIK
jgi:N-acetylmuramoyl-L-alanine amidase